MRSVSIPILFPRVLHLKKGGAVAGLDDDINVDAENNQVNYSTDSSLLILICLAFQNQGEAFVRQDQPPAGQPRGYVRMAVMDGKDNWTPCTASI